MRPGHLAAALLLSAMPLRAAMAVTPATYVFYGQVQSGSGGLNGPDPGAIVYISVTVDTSFPAFSQQNHMTVYYGGSGYGYPSPILALTVNGQDMHGIFDQVTITNNASGTSGLELDTLSPMGLSVTVAFTTTVKGVVTSDKIPKQVFPGNFQTRTFSVEVPPGLTYSGQVVE